MSKQTEVNETKSGHDFEERLQFERLLVDIAASFINLPVYRIDSGIEDAQRRICDFLGLDLSSLWQRSSKGSQFFTLTHLHKPADFEVPSNRINVEELSPWQYKKMMEGVPLAFSTEDLPPEAATDKETCRRLGLKSFVSLPLLVEGGPIIGILTFSALLGARNWSAEMVNSLTLVAQIFINALLRKQSERNWREAEARLATAIDAAALGFYQMNEALFVDFLDDRIRTLLGVSPADEKHGREYWLAHIHSEDLPGILEQSRRVIEEGVDRFVGEYRYIHPERSVIWLHHVSEVLERDADGRAAHIVGVIQDITERKEKEQSLVESRTALRYTQKDLRRLTGKLISKQEKELRRLSRELHDDLSQRLAAIAIEAGKLERVLETKLSFQDRTLLNVCGIKEQLISVSEDIHHISRQLHPTILDDLGLIRAIESECAIVQSREDIVILFRHKDVTGRIANDISLCLYRIVQEGLKNIVRHSGAARCEVLLESAGDALCLVIRDEGMGFDPVAIRNRPGLGLSSMRERALLVLGDFSIDSRPGRGTVIQVRVPLNRGEA